MVGGLIKQTVQEILNILFPIECLGCAAPGAYLCFECRAQCLGPIKKLACPICERASLVGATHPKCQTPEGIDGIFIAGDFSNPLLRRAIKALKYKNVRVLGSDLANFMATRFSMQFRSFLEQLEPTLTYVPLHPSRERWRGYNQSQLLASALSTELQLPYESTLLRRANTADQTKLDKESRKINVADAFRLIEGCSVRGKDFIIVDDVCTTGATLKECAKVLKRNGARLVWGIAIAQD
jgi:competence protein ComFC